MALGLLPPICLRAERDRGRPKFVDAVAAVSPNEVELPVRRSCKAVVIATSRPALGNLAVGSRIRAVLGGGDLHFGEECASPVYGRREEDFLAAVKSKGRIRFLFHAEDGIRYMRVVQAVADSRTRNEWVAIAG